MRQRDGAVWVGVGARVGGSRELGCGLCAREIDTERETERENERDSEKERGRRKTEKER